LPVVPKSGTIVLEMGTKTSSDKLASVLFGKTRRALLSILYGHPDESFYLMQLVRMVGAGKGAVQRELVQLTDAGIFFRNKIGNQIFYQADKNCPVYEELRLIVIKTVGYADVLKAALDKVKGKIKIAFIYGSVARAEETSVSDVDIMVIGDVGFGEAVKAIQKAQQKLKREVNPSVYPHEEFVSKIKSGHHFIKRVMDDVKIFLIGDEDELSRLAR